MFEQCIKTERELGTVGDSVRVAGWVLATVIAMVALAFFQKDYTMVACCLFVGGLMLLSVCILISAAVRFFTNTLYLLRCIAMANVPPQWAQAYVPTSQPSNAQMLVPQAVTVDPPATNGVK